MSHGRRPDCHCFGQLRPTPAGAATLARNGVLLAAALVLFVAGP
ncbi:MAG: MauE/DoxX family redox-associated membrane protein [Acidimicrobiales bacterium]